MEGRGEERRMRERKRGRERGMGRQKDGEREVKKKVQFFKICNIWIYSFGIC